MYLGGISVRDQSFIAYRRPAPSVQTVTRTVYVPTAPQTTSAPAVNPFVQTIRTSGAGEVFVPGQFVNPMQQPIVIQQAAPERERESTESTTQTSVTATRTDSKTGWLLAAVAILAIAVLSRQKRR